MTRAEILAMKPGPELDRLIQERVLGREPHEVTGIPSHSMDIGAAWTLLGWIAEKTEFCPTVSWENQESLVDVTIPVDEERERCEYVSGPGNELAATICKAALLVQFECT